MRQCFSLLVLFLFPLLSRGQSAEKILTSSLAFTHVTVLDMKGGLAKEDMTVMISGNRISSLQKSQSRKLPKGTQVVDAKGKFLLPGLWDMHVHSYSSKGFIQIISSPCLLPMALPVCGKWVTLLFPLLSSKRYEPK